MARIREELQFMKSWKKQCESSCDCVIQYGYLHELCVRTPILWPHMMVEYAWRLQMRWQ
jgi:hypothetical protein